MDASNLQVTPTSLAVTLLLVVFALVISYKEEIQLEKEIIISVLRMIIQLAAVGYLLAGIFRLDNLWITFAMVAVIIGNAAWNAGQRGRYLDHAYLYALIALAVTTVISLGVFIGSGSLKFTPSQIIPVTGMIVGNSMTASGLAYTNLLQLFKDQEQTIQEKLALGATPKQASQTIIQATIKNGMQPTIDRTKTTGLVSLPGMMSGLMFAGVDPTKAILYQIMIMFMLISAAAITTYIVTYLSYRHFFNSRYQLRTNLWKH